MPLPTQSAPLLGRALEDVDRGRSEGRTNRCADRIRRGATGPPSLSFVEQAVSKFLLEVLGAAGALWGCADFLNFRDTPAHTENVRALALLLGFGFLIRYWRHMTRSWEHEREPLPIKTNDRHSDRPAFIQTQLSKFVLQVMGGAGAVWGSAEILMLRGASNRSEWTLTATVVGACFLFRYAVQILAYCLNTPLLRADEASGPMKVLRWFEATAITFDLEVLGAGGAIWGASEIVTLRTAGTNYIWRPVAAAVGVVYAIRWMVSLVRFVQSERDSVGVNGHSQVHIEEDMLNDSSTEGTRTESEADGDDSL